MSLSCVRIPATKTAQNAIIFVHGLGDSGDGWSWFPQIISQTGIFKNQPHTNFVFPNAPTIPITANGGMRMPGWFDIHEFGNPKAKQDEAGLYGSCEAIKKLIDEQIEKHNISPEKIIIGGFSQGAALSMALLPLLDFKIGGVVAISGFCPVVSSIGQKQNKDGINYETPVFQGHGSVDPVIAHHFGEQSSEFYKLLGFKNWTFKTYRGVAHSTNDQELVDVIQFISLILDK